MLYVAPECETSQGNANFDYKRQDDTERCHCRLDSQEVGKEQGEESSKDPKLCADLSKSKMQVEELKNQLGALNSQQNVDMEALPAICRKVDAERSRILCGISKFLAVTAEAKRKRKAIKRNGPWKHVLAVVEPQMPSCQVFCTT